MRERLVRGAVLAYALVICLAAWPFEQTPLLGDAGWAAQRLLARASLAAGMAVFRSSTAADEDQPWTTCTEFWAHSERGSEVIYKPKCPREGTLFFEDSFDKTVTHMLWAPKNALLQGELFPQPGAPTVVRNLFQLNDFFCQIRPGSDQVALRWVQFLRNFQTGEFSAFQKELTCVADCGRFGAPKMRCRMNRVERGKP